MNLLIILLTLLSVNEESPQFDLSLNGVQLPAHRCAIVIIPGDTVSLSVSTPVTWVMSSGTFLSSATETTNVIWVAPRSHGIFSLEVSDTSGTAEYTVMIPVESSRWRTTSLNSFSIGSYGDGNQRDNLPEYFFEITSSTYLLPLSTHLKIADFLCHVDGNYPQYMALDMELIEKLENLVATVQHVYPGNLGITCISGFRTPEYNARIGNDTTESLHLYGRAADIWIERLPSNGLMDDLDRNKRVDIGDGEFLISIIRELESSGLVTVGGASVYRWNRSHGPFIHIDVRGYSASWQNSHTLE